MVGESGRGLSGLRARETGSGILDGLGSPCFIRSPVFGRVGESGRGLSGLHVRETGIGIREGFNLLVAEPGIGLGVLVANAVEGVVDKVP